MSDDQKSEGLNNFTRKYLYLLGGALLFGFILWLTNLDFRAGEINHLLEADAELAAYPYPFRVLSVKDGIAQVSSPRSAQLSAIRSLRVMFPELENRDAVSDEMMTAQEELARIQAHAGQLVKSQEDISRIHWVLDKAWLANHGIYID